MNEYFKLNNMIIYGVNLSQLEQVNSSKSKLKLKLHLVQNIYKNKKKSNLS